MRKITFKIRQGTKQLILGLSILGVLGMASVHTGQAKKAATSFAFIGFVASMKKKNVWETATAEMKSFAEAQDEVMKDLLEKSELDAKLKDFVSKVDIKNQLTDEEKLELKEMNDGYKAIAAKLKKMEDSGLSNEQGANPVKAALMENEAAYKDFLSKKSREFSLEIKGAAQSDTADISGHTLGYRVPGIGQLPVRKPFMLDIFPTVPLSSLEFIKYMDQASITRDAKNVAGIAASTSTSAVTWIERNIQITKVRDFIYVNIDMLADYDFVQGELQRLISSSVILKADNGLLLDNGTYPNLHSVDEKSSEFDAANTLSGTITPWAGTVQAPNIFDLAIAMASQIIALGKDNNYMPDTILWNTLDKYKNMLVKDKQNNYLLPPFVVKVGNTEYSIDNMKVRTNPNVPANTMYVFDSSKGTIYMRKGMGLEMAYNNNSDFEKEIATMKAYMRLNLLIRNVDANAFMKCTDVATAVTALAKV